MRRFTQYAWFVVGFTVLVILWGAVVRATGSGAGCGRHWPLCNGEIVPRAEQIETMIELSHRMTSSFSGVLVIILLIWAYRAFPAKTLVRRSALLSFIFILIEGGLGAGLVLLELVENNASVLRAFAVGLHLLNTFVLLMWMVLTAWSSHYGHDIRLKMTHRPAQLMIIGLVIMAILSSAGAVTALGDTLFLSGALAEQVGEQNAAGHFLVQLRVIHPMMSVAVTIFLFIIGSNFLGQNPPDSIRKLIYGMFAILVMQTLMGLMTIVLKAPIYMQIGHLLIADILWIILLTLTFEVMSKTIETGSAKLQPV